MSSPYRVSIREFRANPDGYWNIKMLSRQPLSQKFMREFADKLDWNIISEKQKMTEDFIHEFKDRINWNKLCTYWAKTKISEQFALEHKDKVNWKTLSYYMKFSLPFIINNIDVLDARQLLSNYQIRDIRSDFRFIDFILKNENIDVDTKHHVWNANDLVFDEEFDFLREHKKYLYPAAIVNRFRNVKNIQKFINEFNDIFTDDDWRSVGYNLYRYDFNFIMKYIDKWNKKRNENPIHMWGYKNSQHRFTSEQEEIINSLWIN